MNGGINDRSLTIINFLIVCYFILIWLANHFQVDYAFTGFFVELLTIPFLLAQFIFLFLGIQFILKNEKRLLTIISLLALAVCTIITIGSFF